MDGYKNKKWKEEENICLGFEATNHAKNNKNSPFEFWSRRNSQRRQRTLTSVQFNSFRLCENQVSTTPCLLCELPSCSGDAISRRPALQRLGCAKPAVCIPDWRSTTPFSSAWTLLLFFPAINLQALHVNVILNIRTLRTLRDRDQRCIVLWRKFTQIKRAVWVAPLCGVPLPFVTSQAAINCTHFFFC